MKSDALLALDPSILGRELRERVTECDGLVPEPLLHQVLQQITQSWQERSNLIRGGDLALEDHLMCLKWLSPKPVKEGFVTDAFGLRTRTEMAHKWAALDGTFAPWGFRSCFEHDVLEWAAVLKAVQRAKTRFTVAELGAGWGPWVTAASVFAKRQGIENIACIAVEADETRHDFIDRHMSDNGVGDVSLSTFLGAIAPSDGEVLFPTLDDSTKDMGFASRPLSDESADKVTDYRGVPLQHKRTPGYSIDHVLNGVERVDFMHIDIQGAEAEIIASGVDLLSEKCAHILCATHARDIEWKVARVLMQHGWVLEHEAPCEMHSGDFWLNSGRDYPLVSRDGTQFWRNPRRAGD